MLSAIVNKRTILICLIVVALLALGCISSFSQEIAYKPVGEMDKPLTEIHIKLECKGEDPLEFVKCFQLSPNDMDSLISFIEIQEFNKQAPDTNYSFGSYKITVVNKDKKLDLFLYGKEATRSFFAKQLYLLRGNKSLVSEVQTLIKRLE